MLEGCKHVELAGRQAVGATMRQCKAGHEHGMVQQVTGSWSVGHACHATVASVGHEI